MQEFALDMLNRLTAPIVKVLPGCVLRKCDPPMTGGNENPPDDIEEMQQFLQVVPNFTSEPARRRQVLFVQYAREQEHGSLQDLYETLSEQLNVSHERLICLSRIDASTLMVTINRNDYANVPDSALQLPGCQIAARSILAGGRRVKGDQQLADAIVAFGKASQESVSDLWLDVLPESRTWGLEQVFAVTKDLDHIGLLNLVARVKQTKADKRDEFQKAFLQLQPELHKLRTLRAPQADSKVINMENRHSMIQPLSQFVPDLLDKRVDIADTSVCPSGHCSLREYLSDENLHLNLSLLVHGPTGLGKSEAMKTCFFAVSVQYLQAQACMWFLNTLDSVRTIQTSLRAGQVLFLDEFDPNSVQIIHSDANLLKVLLYPGVPATIRGRKDDVTIPAGMIRVLTSNSQDQEQWLAGVCARQQDRDAIIRRMATLEVNTSLYVNPGAGRPARAAPLVQRQSTFEEAMHMTMRGM